jgi:hypothetical protein
MDCRSSRLPFPRFLVLTCILLCLAFSGSGATENTARPSLEAAVHAFQQANGDQWVVRMGPDGVTPRTFFARKSRPIAGWDRDRGEAVRSWIRAYGPVMGPDRLEDDLRLITERGGRGLQHLRYQQTYKGIPVFGGEYAVAAEPSGAPRIITGRFYRRLNMDVTPSITADVASTIAASELPGTRPAREAPRLMIVPADELGCDRAAMVASDAILGWDVARIESPFEVRWRVLVDARTGAVVAKGNELLHGPPTGPEDCTSQGCVHVYDPTAGVSTLPLPGLQPDFQSFCPTALRGSQVFVNNMAGQNATPTNEFGDFCFAPTDLHTAEVNAYYHIETFIGGFLAELGYQGLTSPNPPTLPDQGTAYVNGTITPCGTCYQPSTHSWYFFRGPGGFSFENMALAADILVHEAQHAVTTSFGITTNALNQADEANAFHEGVSDYFAAAYTGEPRIGEWAYPSQCNSTGAQWVNNDPEVFNYSNYGTVNGCYGSANEGHSNGMIISGALWTLRSMIGPQVANQYIFEALDLLPSMPRFTCVADAIWAVDQMHGGTLSIQIDATFWQRGIIGSQPSTISGPTSLAPNVAGTYTLVPECHRAPENPAWSMRCRPCTGAPPCGDWLPLGGGLSVSVSSQTQFDLKAAWTGLNGEPMEASRLVTVSAGPAPDVSIEGPPSAPPDEFTQYTAHPTGVAPFRYGWRVRFHDHVQGWLPYSALGSGPTQDVVPACDAGDFDKFDLEATVTDPYCRSKATTISVTVTPPCNGAAGAPGLEIVPIRADVSYGIDVNLVAGESSVARLSLFDISGRRFGTVWEGRIERGKQSVHWSSPELKPGLYFLRLERASGAVSRRVLVLDP